MYVQVKDAIISYMHGSIAKEHTVSAKNIELTELNPGTEYEVSVMLVYEDGQRSAAHSFVFTTLAKTAEGQTSGSQAGVITGGAIGE